MKNMVKESEAKGALEWRINVGASSQVLLPETVSKSIAIKRFFETFASRVSGFFTKAWNIGSNEPRKVFHCVKVGVALSLVSLFYYMRPLYEGVGGNAMWAVMTVVVVFEYTVGATLSKCVNRTIGTFMAGALGIGVHWIASHSGERLEPAILQGSVFLLAVAATFSRFIPSIKARFDYGAMIFILTFSLVSVSGYRVEKLFELAHHRLSTIAIGTSICILTTMTLCPVWAGKELHNLMLTNMEKFASSLDGCVRKYLRDNDAKASDPVLEESSKVRLGYKCVLNSKATEESLANFARWEPAHGNFNFRHPWKEYLKIGASLRSCAYCLETLNATSSIGPDTKASGFIKNRFRESCLLLSSRSATVIKELAVIFGTMTRSSKIDLRVEEMNDAVKDLQNELDSLSRQTSELTEIKPDNCIGEGNSVINLVDIIPLVTISSLLVEIATRTEKTVAAVNQLADKAGFRVVDAEKLRIDEGEREDRYTFFGTSWKI